MGHKVVFYGEPSGSRTQRAVELVPPDLDFGVVDPGLPADKKREQLADAEALVTNGMLISNEMVRDMPKLKLLQVMSAGFDTLDVRSIREMGVEVCNNSEAISNSVAEHAIALMLMVYKRLSQGLDGVRQGTWQEPAKSGPYGRLYELAGRTVGIVGLGHIGSKVARRLQGFETTTLYADVREIPAATERELRVQRASMDDLLERSDVVTVHVPLSRTTQGLFSTPQFKAMRDDAIFINTCRGPVHDEAALIRVLRDGDIAAAGLDVTEVEPTPLDNPLLKMDNVIVTPHLAGSSQERVDRAIVFSFDNARRVLNGEKPLSPVQLVD